MKTEHSIALGTFDGLHLGHEQVLSQTKQGNGTPAALLFTEHPQAVVRGQAPPALLTDAMRDSLLKAEGILPLPISFREIYKLSAEDFFYEILLKRFHASALACGENYTFGTHKSGNVSLLQALCDRENLPLYVAKTVEYGGKPISSTRIRRAIESGEMEDAAAMLGRPFAFAFPVVHGAARGRTLDCPTINQPFAEDFIQPRRGVYISRVTVDGKTFAGVTNFGRRPTVGTNEVLAETYILNLSQNLYGTGPRVELLSFLRPEQKFESLHALRSAILADSQKAVEYFQKSLAKQA